MRAVDVKYRAARLIDPMVERKADPRIAWAVLVGAMFLSAVYCLWATRGSTFTGDEIAWVSFSPGLDFRQSIEPHSGHLIFVTLWLYKAILAVVGTDYLTFRLLTLSMVFLAVLLLFIWSRKRVGEFVALAPCLVLLFFGSDPGNLLQGIGFTIMLGISCGMLALVALDRGSRGGDLIACGALTLGVISFTLALPFLAGAIVAVLLTKERWRRIWIVAIPLAVYLAWRIWLLAANVDVPNGEAHLSNLPLLPSWTFQSLSGIFSALTGFNHNFTSGSWLPAGEAAGPTLALGFLVLIGWRIHGGTLRPWFLVTVTIMVALFASQVLGWVPGVRSPATSRYLFPGAFAVVLVLAEAFRAYPFSRTAFISIWLIAACAFATNVVYIRDSGRTFRERGPHFKSEVTASLLVNQAVPFFPGANSKPLQELVENPGISITSTAEAEYGGLGFSEDELLQQSPDLRAHADSIMASSFGLGLIPDAGSGANCKYRPVDRAGADGRVVMSLAPGGALLKSPEAGGVSVKRFGDEYSIPVGQLIPGRRMRLYIPADQGRTPWRLSAAVPALSICNFTP